MSILFQDHFLYFFFPCKMNHEHPSKSEINVTIFKITFYAFFSSLPSCEMKPRAPIKFCPLKKKIIVFKWYIVIIQFSY